MMTDTIIDPLDQMEQDSARTYNQGLTPLHPPHKSLIRLNIGIIAAILFIASMVAEFFIRDELPLAAGAVAGPVAVIAIVLFTLLPDRIYRRWGYDMGASNFVFCADIFGARIRSFRLTGFSILMWHRGRSNG